MFKCGHKASSDDRIPPNLSYLIDGRGELIQNDEGKAIRRYMQSVCWNAFRYDILTKWENIERAHKECV